MDAALFAETTTSIYRYLGIPLYIFGNLGNIFCLMIFLQRSWRKNVCVFYFLICLLFDTFSINVSLLGSIFILSFKINLTSSNVPLCKIYNYFTLLFSTLSPTILILASIDRLLISSQNVDTRLYSSRRLAYLLVGTNVTFWFIFFFHVLIKFDIQQFGFFTSMCLFDMEESYAIFMAYSMVTINIASFVVMIILSILSCKNVRRIRSIPRRQRQTVRTMRKKDFQLLRCLFIKDIIYILCNAALCIYSIYRLIRQFHIPSLWQQQFDVFIYDLGSLIHHIPFCLNLYTYVLVSKALREDFKQLIWKIIGKETPTVREDEVNELEGRREMNESIAISTIIS